MGDRLNRHPPCIAWIQSSLCWIFVAVGATALLSWWLYICLPTTILSVLESERNPRHIEDVLQATQEHIDHTLKFSTCFVSESARLA